MQYRVATNARPTFFNKNAALGFMLGLIGFMAITPVAIPAISLSAAAAVIAFPLAGAVGVGMLGGIVGRARMSRELHEGKVVKEPTLFNMKTVTGALIGLVVGGFLAVVLTPIAAPYIVPLLVSTHMAATTAAAAALAPAVIFSTGEVIGTVFATLIGGRIGEREMRREHDAAARMAQMQEFSDARTRQIEHEGKAAPIPSKSQGRAAAPSRIEPRHTTATALTQHKHSAVAGTIPAAGAAGHYKTAEPHPRFDGRDHQKMTSAPMDRGVSRSSEGFSGTYQRPETRGVSSENKPVYRNINAPYSREATGPATTTDYRQAPAPHGAQPTDVTGKDMPPATVTVTADTGKKEIPATTAMAADSKQPSSTSANLPVASDNKTAPDASKPIAIQITISSTASQQPAQDGASKEQQDGKQAKDGAIPADSIVKQPVPSTPQTETGTAKTVAAEPVVKTDAATLPSSEKPTPSKDNTAPVVADDSKAAAPATGEQKPDQNAGARNITNNTYTTFITGMAEQSAKDTQPEAKTATTDTQAVTSATEPVVDKKTDIAPATLKDSTAAEGVAVTAAKSTAEDKTDKQTTAANDSAVTAGTTETAQQPAEEKKDKQAAAPSDSSGAITSGTPAELSSQEKPVDTAKNTESGTPAATASEAAQPVEDQKDKHVGTSGDSTLILGAIAAASTEQSSKESQTIAPATGDSGPSASPADAGQKLTVADKSPDAEQPSVVQISISNVSAEPQPADIAAANPADGADTSEKSHVADVLAKRARQQQSAAETTSPAEKKPRDASFATSLTTEREQPAIQGQIV